MHPITKAHSITFAITTAIAYSLWSKLSTIQTEFPIINFCISFIISLAFYRGIFKILLLISQKICFLRRLILGKYYLEGLWIGYYSVENTVEYYYEIVEQDLENLLIKGTAFTEDFQHVGTWTITNPTVNIVESKLTYFYEMDITTCKDITLGYSRATIYWDKLGYAYKETGFAIDNFSSNKQEYISIKVSGIKNYQTWIKENFFTEVKMLHNGEL